MTAVVRELAKGNLPLCKGEVVGACGKGRGGAVALVPCKVIHIGTGDGEKGLFHAGEAAAAELHRAVLVQIRKISAINIGIGE